MAGLVPAIHAPPPQRRGRHHCERYKAYRAELSGRVARFRLCVARNRVDGRVKPGHDASLADARFPIPRSRRPQPTRKKSRKMFQYSEIHAITICMHGIYTSYDVYVYGPRKGVRLGYPGPSRRIGRAKKLSAKFARNPLKRLISDERIQGNPSFSNPL